MLVELHIRGGRQSGKTTAATAGLREIHPSLGHKGLYLGETLAYATFLRKSLKGAWDVAGFCSEFSRLPRYRSVVIDDCERCPSRVLDYWRKRQGSEDVGHLTLVYCEPLMDNWSI